MSKKTRLKQFQNEGLITETTTAVKPAPKKDKSPVIPQRTKIKNELHIIHRELTPRQQEFLKLAADKNTKMIMISGPAGTAKTYLCVLAALELLNSHHLSDIIYVRSVVESADAKMGFLPGEQDDKFSPYIRPLMDKVDELLPREEAKYLSQDGRFEGLPLGFLRGLNWNAKAIIGDELQNCTKKELITLMTRVGEFSKLFLIGDPMQSDIGSKSGFKEVFGLFSDAESKEHGIYTFEFTEEDIVRSKLVRFIAKKVKNLI